MKSFRSLTGTFGIISSACLIVLSICGVPVLAQRSPTVSPTPSPITQSMPTSSPGMGSMRSQHTSSRGAGMGEQARELLAA